MTHICIIQPQWVKWWPPSTMWVGPFIFSSTILWIYILSCTDTGKITSVSMGWSKKDVTPLLMHWSYIFLALTHRHCNDIIRSVMAYQITTLTIVYTTVYSGADQRKHQSSTLLAFVRGIHQSPVSSPHKGSAMRKMLPFDDVIMDM